MYKFGNRSESNLVGVHADLVKVARLALLKSPVDFGISEGLRTKTRQAELFAAGKSKTMNSRHITGHAIDIFPAGNPIDWKKMIPISKAMFEAANELNIPIRWGGDWNGNGITTDEKFFDSPHFELKSKFYP